MSTMTYNPGPFSNSSDTTYTIATTDGTGYSNSSHIIINNPAATSAAAGSATGYSTATTFAWGSRWTQEKLALLREAIKEVHPNWAWSKWTALLLANTSHLDLERVDVCGHLVLAVRLNNKVVYVVLSPTASLWKFGGPCMPDHLESDDILAVTKTKKTAQRCLQLVALAC